MDATRWVASLTFLAGVPLAIWLAFVGHWRGLYGYSLIPVAFGVVAGILFGVLLFGLLPALNRVGN